MQYASEAVVFGRAFMDTIMAALATRPAGALIVAGKIRLTTDPAFNPQPDATIAELTPHEAAYSGYAAGGLTFTPSVPLNLSPGCQGVIGSGLFTATTATPFVDAVVTGYWVDDGVNVIMAEAFPAGVSATFAAPGDFLELVAQLPGQLAQHTA